MLCWVLDRRRVLSQSVSVGSGGGCSALVLPGSTRVQSGSSLSQSSSHCQGSLDIFHSFAMQQGHLGFSTEGCLTLRVPGFRHWCSPGSSHSRGGCLRRLGKADLFPSNNKLISSVWNSPISMATKQPSWTERWTTSAPKLSQEIVGEALRFREVPSYVAKLRGVHECWIHIV